MADKKVATSVLALSSAAVLAVYGAGYARTREAADRFAQQAAERRPHIPAPLEMRPAAVTEISPATPTPVPEAPVATQPVVAELEARNPATTPADAPRTGAASPAPAPETVPARVGAGSGEAAAAPPPVAASARDQAATSTPAPAPTPAAQSASAPAPAAAQPAAAADAAKPLYKDGTYYGWGTSRHGDIQAEVVIEEGRIVLARVETCQTRWSCNWVSPIPPVIYRKQATTYDYVSGATESSDAFQGAVAEALSQAK